MKETEIRGYANLMKELGLTTLEITENGKTLRLERAVAAAPAAQSLAQAEAEAKPAAEALTATGEEITSPMIGVFYAASAENAQPFVQVGSHVKKGDTLCIIEAMKLMNEITAEYDGTVTEVCVRNGQTVDFGTLLFRVER